MKLASGQGIKWKNKDYEIYIKVDIVLEKTEKNEVSYRAQLFRMIRIIS